MPTYAIGDGLERLSLNQRTFGDTALDQVIFEASRAGIRAVGVWRESIAHYGLRDTKHMLSDYGMRVSSLCRSGYFTDPATHARALDDNFAAIDEAAEIGAGALVFVAGGLAPGDRDIGLARDRTSRALDVVVPRARDRGVRVAIEALHPIFAADRGVISTLSEALDIAERFDSTDVGVVADTFHLWWDPALRAQLRRATGRIQSYQISDWITPLPADTLLSRGMMGDGHIDFATFTSAVAETGYDGDVEVEIFNQELWSRTPRDVVTTIVSRYRRLVSAWL